MTPQNIVAHAVEKGLDIIAITDHNACDNVSAALVAAQGTDLVVLPGMEVETQEEAHFVVLFAKMRQLKAFEAFIEQYRPPLKNNEEKFGAQFIVDADNELVGIKEEMLLGSLSITALELIEKVRELDGVVIAAHIDRPMYSIISQLGFLPPDMDLDGVELSRNAQINAMGRLLPEHIAVIRSSDAHRIDDFMDGKTTCFYLESPTLEEIRQALRKINNRKAVVE